MPIFPNPSNYQMAFPLSFEIVSRNGVRSYPDVLANSEARALQIYENLKKPGDVVIITDKQGTRYRVDLGKLLPNR